MTSPSSPDPRRDSEEVRYYRARPRKRSTLSLTIRTALIAGAASVAIAAGLAWQMAAGADPALTASTQATPAEPSRKIVQTTVVQRIVGSGTSSGSTGGSGSSSSGTSAPTVSSAPVVSSPAPVTSSTS